MSMYNLIEYSDNYSKTSGSLWQNCRDEPALNDDNGIIVGVNEANSTTNLFKLKEKISGKAGNNGAKYIEILVPLK